MVRNEKKRENYEITDQEYIECKLTYEYGE